MATKSAQTKSNAEKQGMQHEQLSGFQGHASHKIPGHVDFVIDKPVLETEIGLLGFRSMKKQNLSLENNPDMRAFSEILNHGPELDNALERFPYDRPKSKEAKVILECFGEWIKGHGVSGRLCFAEIMFFRHSGESFGDRNIADPKKARAFIMAPEARSVKTYKKLLDDFFADGHALTMHDDFQKTGVSFWNGKDLVNGYLLHEMSKNTCHEEKAANSGPEFKRGTQREPVRANHIETSPHILSKKAVISRAPSDDPKETLIKRWGIWCETFKKQRSNFPSSAGQQLGWLAAVPIGYRNPDNASEFQFIAAVFFGGDEQLEEDEVKDFLRYIALQIFEQNISILRWAKGHPDESKLWHSNRMGWFSTTTSAVRHSWGEDAGFQESEKKILDFIEASTGRKLTHVEENLFVALKTLVGKSAICHHPKGRDQPSIGAFVLLLALAGREVYQQNRGAHDWFKTVNWTKMGHYPITSAKNQTDARESIRALMFLFDVLVPHKQPEKGCTIEKVEWKDDINALEIHLNINCLERSSKHPDRHPLWRTVSVGGEDSSAGETAGRFLEAKRLNSQLHFCLRPDPKKQEKSILLIYCIKKS